MPTIPDRLLFEAAAAARPEIRATKIEISESAAKAIIVREGNEVKTPTLNKDRVGVLIDKLKPRRPVDEPRAIDQSVPPGTRVSRGTVIDLVFAPPADIDLSLIGIVHKDLTDRPITFVANLVAQPTIKALLARVDDPAQLTPEDKVVLQTAVTTAQLPIEIDPNPQSERSAERLFLAVSGAAAFL